MPCRILQETKFTLHSKLENLCYGSHDFFYLIKNRKKKFLFWKFSGLRCDRINLIRVTNIWIDGSWFSSYNKINTGFGFKRAHSVTRLHQRLHSRLTPDALLYVLHWTLSPVSMRFPSTKALIHHSTCVHCSPASQPPRPWLVCIASLATTNCFSPPSNHLGWQGAIWTASRHAIAPAA